MKVLSKIKQYFCDHLMLPGWGLCMKCGWNDPNWSAEEMVMAACPWMDEEYRKAELDMIQKDGELSIRLMQAKLRLEGL